MAKPNQFVSRIYVKLDGSEVERSVMKKLLEMTVDQATRLPDMFTLRFRDQGLELLDNGPFDLAKEIEIEAATEDGNKVQIFKGEITAVEPRFQEGMVAEVIFRGYDKTLRLYRETKRRSFLNMKDSDIASKIAQDAGLQGDVESTNTVYEHVYQDNQTDLEFLMARAIRIGFEVCLADGKLHFRKPPAGASAAISLTWGSDLLSFEPRMTLADQVSEVVVKGWSVDRKEPLVGSSQNGQLYPAIGETKNGATWAESFGTGKKVIVDQSMVSQAEADILASAQLDEISGLFVQAEGQAFRRPDIRAGKTIELKGLGKRLNGTYFVTSATHIYTAEGLRTHFSVRGLRSDLLSEELGGRADQKRWPGAVVGIVTNTDDPEDWGRVKVKYPWMSEDVESHWARVVGIGAGPEAGLYVMPEVDDEVLVIFGHGEINQPFVLGGLWNGLDAIPPEGGNSSAGERPLVRTWRSRSGHWIAMFDNADNKVEIITSGGHNVTLDDANRLLSIKTSGGQSIILDDSSSKISIESQSEIEIKSNGNLKIEAAANIDLQAGGQLTIKGAVINLN